MTDAESVPTQAAAGEELVTYAFADGLATLELHAPERGNALDLPLLETLEQQVRRARADDARVVLLTAAGTAWCVGGDLGPVADTSAPGELIDAMAESLHRSVSELNRMDAVVVARVQGIAAGAGVPLAAAADIVLAAESARFTLAYTRIGFTPDGGSSLLTASLGLHRALYLALLNPVLTASEARSAGLVAEVHPDEEVEAATSRTVRALLSGARDAQVGAKRLLRAAALTAPEQAMRLETLSIRRAADSADGREGVAAFLDKRRPSFPTTRPHADA